jgi:hypothetical protein
MTITQNNVMYEPAGGGGGDVPASREVATQHSLTGGGDLSANRTLSLAGDTASPGPNKVYGTDSSGARGWKDDPAGGQQPFARWSYADAAALASVAAMLGGVP